MKTNIMRKILPAWLAILVSASAVAAWADGKSAGDEKTYTGTVKAVDVAGKTIKVQWLMLSKHFVLGDNCALVLGDKKDVSLGDFQPGQKVEVTYKSASGVLVANRIEQEKMLFKGEVVALDANGRTVIVRNRGTSKMFTLPDSCMVVLNGDKSGTFNDVKPGSRVTVVYEVPGNELVARQIEEKSAVFVGSLDAINLPDRTVSAGKKYLSDKKFHLADDCAIMVNGKPEGRMNDLRLGQKYELSYDTVDGINVVNRIAPLPTQETSEVSQAGQAGH